VWYATRQSDADALWEDSQGWRLSAPASSAWVFSKHRVQVDMVAAKSYIARLGDATFSVRVLARGAESLHAECNGQVYLLHLIAADPLLHVFRLGRHTVLHLDRTEDALHVASAAEQGSLLTPLPGTLVAVHVAAGQRVARGTPLVTVEAMKMEHTLTAPYDGVVTRIAFGIADRVPAGAILVELAALEN
jgi:3-methylcrotonyl-CoA carboxylase alpha subunit